MDVQDISKLCSLPAELLVHILSLAHPATLVACRAVCKLLLKLVDDTMVLQYHIELYADGMIDGKCSTLTVAERLSLLRTRRQGWKDMKWGHRMTPLIPGPWNAYELVDGIFSKTLNSTENNSARGILFASLPSRDSPGSLTIIQDIGLSFRDFAMDPTQDLVVYMQCNRVSDVMGSGPRTHVTLHFRTMSDNKIHPRARHSSVVMVLNTDVLGAVIQTVNDVVGFMSWDNACAQLYIWDWKRCIQLVSESNLAPLDDFAFISDRAYVLASPVPEPRFRVYTYGLNLAGCELPTPPKLHATLHLPIMREGAGVALLGIHTGPFTTTSPQPRGQAKPFVSAPHCRIHVVNIDLASSLNAAESAVSCLIVIRNKTFLSFVNKAVPDEIPWESWGPEHTRWIPGGTGSSWLRYVHGERLVRLNATTEVGKRSLEVYDFGAPQGPHTWVTPEEHLAMHQAHALFVDSVFTSPVVFRLPCRLVSRDGYYPYSGFMVDEERLIGLKRHWTDDVESVDVFTF